MSGLEARTSPPEPPPIIGLALELEECVAEHGEFLACPSVA